MTVNSSVVTLMGRKLIQNIVEIVFLKFCTFLSLFLRIIPDTAKKNNISGNGFVPKAKFFKSRWFTVK